MRAGLLKDKVVFQKLVEIRTETGAVEKSYVDDVITRAWRKKLSANVGSGMDAYEEYIANTLILQVRKNNKITELHRVSYKGKLYKIVVIDEQSDNTYLITMRKINE